MGTLLLLRWAMGVEQGCGGDPGTGAVEVSWALQQSCGGSGQWDTVLGGDNQERQQGCSGQLSSGQ